MNNANALNVGTKMEKLERHSALKISDFSLHFLFVRTGETSTTSPVPTRQPWVLWTLMQDTGSWSSKFLLKFGNKEMVTYYYGFG